jgi:hypothetical protein
MFLVQMYDNYGHPMGERLFERIPVYDEYIVTDFGIYTVYRVIWLQNGSAAIQLSSSIQPIQWPNLARKNKSAFVKGGI